LRWLDHPDGWRLIRQSATREDFVYQESAVELLGYDNDPATRDLLLRLLATTDAWNVFAAALKSARRLLGAESLEPEYAAVQNGVVDLDELEESFRRLQEKGDARRLLEILSKLPEEAADRIKGYLLSRQPPPIAEAQAVLTGPDAAAAGVAAHLLGRAGPGTAAVGKAVATALQRWWAEWDKSRQEEARRGLHDGTMAGKFSGPLQSLVWAAGRLGVAADTLLTIATTRSGVPFDRPLRREAIAALASVKLTKSLLAELHQLATGDDPEIRTLAAETVVRSNPVLMAEIAGRVLSDRVTFNRLAARDAQGVADTLRGALAQVHSQGIAVPHLVRSGDVKGLQAVAANPGFNEETRLGAVEGLAAVASEPAEKELLRIAQAQDQPEELRKAAWRGLRRSKRARQRKPL
jgi:ParB family chromosome partitioning protein